MTFLKCKLDDDLFLHRTLLWPHSAPGMKLKLLNTAGRTLSVLPPAHQPPLSPAITCSPQPQGCVQTSFLLSIPPSASSLLDAHAVPSALLLFLFCWPTFLYLPYGPQLVHTFLWKPSLSLQVQTDQPFSVVSQCITFPIITALSHCPVTEC